MKKYIFFITFLIIFAAASGETINYSFNLGNVKIKDAKLSRKNKGYRKFSGLLENRTGKNLTISLNIYFKDPEMNYGREILVSSPTFYSIPARSTKTFRTTLPVGKIKGRDFKVRVSKILESK